MLHPVPTLKETPSQTAGPYVHIGMTPNYCELPGVYAADLGASMIGGEVVGERITVDIRIFDGADAPLVDGLIEVWQADAAGNYASPGQTGFSGWGRQAAMADGVFRFETIKPGRVVAPDDTLMAPHLSLWIVARGINIGLQTRLYFADEAEANKADFVLNKIINGRRRETLVASREPGPPPVYRLDIHLQGPQETVFFDI